MCSPINGGRPGMPVPMATHAPDAAPDADADGAATAAGSGPGADGVQLLGSQPNTLAAALTALMASIRSLANSLSATTGGGTIQQAPGAEPTTSASPLDLSGLDRNHPLVQRLEQLAGAIDARASEPTLRALGVNDPPVPPTAASFVARIAALQQHEARIGAANPIRRARIRIAMERAALPANDPAQAKLEALRPMLERIRDRSARSGSIDVAAMLHLDVRTERALQPDKAAQFDALIPRIKALREASRRPSGIDQIEYQRIAMAFQQIAQS